MPDGIDLKRIINLDPETTVTDDDYTIVDSANGGAKKFALGQALNDLKSDLSEKLDAPSTAGTSGQVLTSDGNGGQTWQTPQGGGGSGLTDDIKEALLQIASKVTYIDEHGQDYYDALEEALYPPAELVSISAVYTQSGMVYDTDSLDDLKSDLVVTALYDDQTTETVTSYTLSGSLTEGTSVITVSYGGKTTTFEAIVTHEPGNPFDNVHWNDGLRLSGASEYTGQNNYTTTDFVDVSDISSVTLTMTSKSGNVQYYVCWYTSNANNTYVSNTNGYINYSSQTYPASTTATKPENANYCRICTTKASTGAISNYPYVLGILDITVG